MKRSIQWKNLRETAKNTLNYKLKLTSQFRCNGSDGYVSWLDDVLEISETGNFDDFEFEYDFKLKWNLSNSSTWAINKESVI